MRLPATLSLSLSPLLLLPVGVAYRVHPLGHTGLRRQRAAQMAADQSDGSDGGLLERIAELRQRKKELEQTVQQEVAMDYERVGLRLPADVVPGNRYDAVLPSGVRVRFTAPENAVPGMVVRISAPTSDPSMASAVEEEEADDDYDEDDEDEEDEYDEDDDEEEDDDDDEEEVDDEEMSSDAESQRTGEETEEAVVVESGNATDGEGVKVRNGNSGSASASASDSPSSRRRSPTPHLILALSQEVEAEAVSAATPQQVAAERALKDGDLSKALLTTLFGESKADRQLRLAEAAAEARREYVQPHASPSPTSDATARRLAAACVTRPDPVP